MSPMPLLPKLLSHWPGSCRLGLFSLILLACLRGAGAEPTGSADGMIENPRLQVGFTNGLITVFDQRNQRQWCQVGTGKKCAIRLTRLEPRERTMVFQADLPATDTNKASVSAPFTLTLHVDSSRPEYTLSFKTSSRA